MSKMQTVAHFELRPAGCHNGGNAPIQQLMRDPTCVAEMLASINEIAARHAKAAGVPIRSTSLGRSMPSRTSRNEMPAKTGSFAVPGTLTRPCRSPKCLSTKGFIDLNARN